MKKYFTFDNEPITGWTFFWRNIIGTFALILFIIPGFWIWSANAYKRAGTFQWSNEMRIICVFAIIISQASRFLSKIPEYMALPMNAFDYLAFACSILTFILLVKNGNKNLVKVDNDVEEIEYVECEDLKSLVNLSKGSTFNLSKEAPSLEVARISLGCNTCPCADPDFSALCVAEDGHLPEVGDFVFYGSKNFQVLEGEDGPRPYSSDTAVYGADTSKINYQFEPGGQVDMIIYFDRISENIKEIIIVATIHFEVGEDKIDFSNVDSEFYFSILDSSSEVELCRYSLSDDFGTADSVEIGKFIREGSGWSFTALGNARQDGITGFIKKYAYRF